MVGMDQQHQQQQQELHDLLNPISNKKTKKKSNNNKKKRRFSNEQIKSLEAIFESQSKLDPRKKLQLARDLGLHPRQVAIWFQNKRARYKSKQLETEYSSLKASYNSLASSFEALKKENQALANQLEKLRNEAGKSCGFSVVDEVEESVKAEYFVRLDHDEPASMVKMVESGDGSLSCSAENWGGLGADGLFDESGSSYQWWDCLP